MCSSDLTSSSTVKNFVQAVTEQNRHPLTESIGEAKLVAIGPITAETAEQFGLRLETVATEHTIPGLVTALEETFKNEAQHG